MVDETSNNSNASKTNEFDKEGFYNYINVFTLSDSEAGMFGAAITTMGGDVDSILSALEIEPINESELDGINPIVASEYRARYAKLCDACSNMTSSYQIWNSQQSVNAYRNTQKEMREYNSIGLGASSAKTQAVEAFRQFLAVYNYIIYFCLNRST